MRAESVAPKRMASCFKCVKFNFNPFGSFSEIMNHHFSNQACIVITQLSGLKIAG
jgi:hypothetical protein